MKFKKKLILQLATKIIVAVALLAALLYLMSHLSGPVGQNATSTHTSTTMNYTGAVLHTTKGDIEISFFGTEAPKTVANFVTLAGQKFYDGTKFHRVIKNFMIQGGDPLTKGNDTQHYGTGGPDYTFNDEFNNEKVVRGAVAMANRGPNTNGSQFFIVTTQAAPWLDGKHTVFAKVVKGMEVVDAIENSKTIPPNDLPVEPIVVTSVTLK